MPVSNRVNVPRAAVTTPKSTTPKAGTGPKHTVNPAPPSWVAPKYSTAQTRKAFWFSPYTNADAKTAMKAFKLKTIDEAKAFIGRSILGKSESQLQQAGITRARWDKQDCLAAFDRSGYSDADVATAKKKFDFLKGASNEDVREYIGLKIVNKYESMLNEVGISRSPFDKQDMMEAFKRSKYTDADAKKALKALPFCNNLQGAKEYIGLKIINGTTSILKDVGVTPSKK